MLKKNSNVISGQILLFIIWPFLSLLISLKNRKTNWSKNLFWLFCIYYGFTFVIARKGIDAYRYTENLILLSQSSYSFEEFISFLFRGETNYVDFLNPLITFLISRFTSDGRVLLAAYGMIFGYFYSRNIWYLFERTNYSKLYLTLLIVVAFSLIDPIWKLGAFRFNTAIQVFLFGIIPFLVNGNKKYIWVSFLSVFIHFAFIAPLIVLVIYLFVGNRPKFFFFLFIVSFFITELNLDFIRSQFSNLPDVFQSKADIYMTNESYEYYSSGINKTNWYIKYYGPILKYMMTVFILAIFIYRRDIFTEENRLLDFWCFTTLFYSFANILNLLPQGIRFYGLANLLSLFLLAWIASLSKIPSAIRRLLYISIPLLCLVIIVDIRRGFDFTGLMTIFGNPFISSFFEGDIPLINLIK